MVLRNIIFVPYWFCQLLWYAAHTDSIPEEKKLALLKKIVAHANAGGNVTVKAYGTEHIPRDGSFMFYPNHQGLYDVLAIIDTCPRLFSVVMKKELKDIFFLKQVFQIYVWVVMMTALFLICFTRLRYQIQSLLLSTKHKY